MIYCILTIRCCIQIVATLNYWPHNHVITVIRIMCISHFIVKYLSVDLYPGIHVPVGRN